MPIEPLNSYKQHVARSFEKAAASYDSHALFQQEVLSYLLKMLPTRTYSTTLDLGCGTGNALAQLAAMSERLMALDLSPAMLLEARKKISKVDFVCADAEALPFVDARFEVVFSSVASQCSVSQARLFQQLHSALSANGIWAFSTLCEHSMPEIANIWLELDGCSHTNQYPPLPEIVDNLQMAGFALHQQELRTVTVWFDTPQAAIYSLKKVGASLITDQQNQRVVSPSSWRRFMAKYESLREAKGIPLSYQVAYLVAQKTES